MRWQSPATTRVFWNPATQRLFRELRRGGLLSVSETETRRHTTVSHGTEDEFPFPSLANLMQRVLSEYGGILIKSPNNGCRAAQHHCGVSLPLARHQQRPAGQIVIGSGANTSTDSSMPPKLLGRRRVLRSGRLTTQDPQGVSGARRRADAAPPAATASLR